MKLDLESSVKAAIIAATGFFRAPVLEVRITDSNVVQDYKARISSLNSDLEKLKERYNVLGRAYANECQVNIRLTDELKQLRKEK